MYTQKPKKCFYRTSLAALASMMFYASQALAAAPFTYAAYGYFQDVGVLLLDEDLPASGTASVSGTDGQKSRASYGENGVALPSGGGYALSVWSDAFVVNGGTGVGTLNFSVQLHGTLFDTKDVVYALLKSGDRDAFFPEAIVAQADYGYETLSNTTPVLLVELDDTPDFHPPAYSLPSGFVNSLFNASVDFNYGEPFYLASILDIGGYGDFYNSATFGITAPEGAIINNLSGSTYPVASVPLGETWALMLAGLSLMGLIQRRK